MADPIRFSINDRQFEHNDELPVVSQGPENSFTVVSGNSVVEVFAHPDGKLSDGSGLDGVEVILETQRERIIKERFGAVGGVAGGMAGKQHNLKAPMPGLVKKILVQPGEIVTKLTPVFILEAMKMENVLLAGRQGILYEVNVSEGKNVEKNTVLGVITEE